MLPQGRSDPALTQGATGVTVTEAQALVVLRNIRTDEVVPVPMGTSVPKVPPVTDKARPARATTEVASPAGTGRLVEAEVTAACEKHWRAQVRAVRRWP